MASGHDRINSSADSRSRCRFGLRVLGISSSRIPSINSNVWFGNKPRNKPRPRKPGGGGIRYGISTKTSKKTPPFSSSSAPARDRQTLPSPPSASARIRFRTLDMKRPIIPGHHDVQIFSKKNRVKRGHPGLLHSEWFSTTFFDHFRLFQKSRKIRSTSTFSGLFESTFFLYALGVRIGVYPHDSSRF